ncbi:MAG: DUF1553 domain-containing protein, partial [Planctomycetales bacterium]
GNALATALQKDIGSLSPAERSQLREYYLSNFDERHLQLTRQLGDLRARQRDLVNPIPELMVMEEMSDPRPTYLLVRGAYDQRSERIYPETPHSILGFADNLPRNRLGLARWLTDPKNPLTARVAVNRYWQMMFGSGLVDPPNDFGSQGSAPTHPKLLDWLALRYIESDWDTKELLRLIASSSTYRQSSRASPQLRERDPKNRLLARGPKQRLTAEMIRDSALSVSGLLVNRLGGQPVRPYQPPGLWKEKRPEVVYETGKGDDLYRRSLYTIWKRTSPPPAMIAFDAPRRSVCTVHRQQTGTPLQALVLLNDPQYVEAARLLAERMLREGGQSLKEQIKFAFRLTIGRDPSDQELQSLSQLYRAQFDLFKDHPDDVKRLLSVGDKTVDSTIDPTQLAAQTIVASTLFSMDEFVT